MPYSFIVLVVSVALAVYFVFVTEASVISKVIVSGGFLFGFACFFGWIAGWWLIGLFLLVGLSVFILFYRALQEARWDK
jgi:hypothetical protein